MTEFNETTCRIPVLNTGRIITVILCQPVNVHNNIQASHPAPLAVIAHGFGGHKDYCYQQQLARQLALSLGISSARLDFSSCSDSPVPKSTGLLVKRSSLIPDQDMERGAKEDMPSSLEWVYIRTVESDIQDLQAVEQYFCEPQASLNSFCRNEAHFQITSCIGHSRGLLAILAWLEVRQRDSKLSPTIKHVVNCSGRFQTNLIWDFHLQRDPLFLQHGGCVEKVRGPRNSLIPLWISVSEISDLAGQDISHMLDVIVSGSNSSIGHIPKFLSIYGTADTVVPLNDSVLFHNALLSKTKSTNEYSKLVWIQNADHNFYGVPRHFGERKADYNNTVVQTILNWISISYMTSKL